MTQRADWRSGVVPATLVMRAGLAAVSVLSVANFNSVLLPVGDNFQQVIIIGIWVTIIAASRRAVPVWCIGTGIETGAVLAFNGFILLSMGWSDVSPSAYMKGAAFLVTLLGAWCVATRLRLPQIADACLIGFSIVIGASLFLAAFVPAIGVDHTWMHEGEWQGVFESKQALGTVGGFQLLFAFHRLVTRGGWLVFAIGFGLALGAVIGSGSRGGGAVAVAACVCLYLSGRSTVISRVLAFTPCVMILVAILAITYLVSTGHEYLPLFGQKVDFTERGIIWQYALRHFAQSPIIGWGLNGFWSYGSNLHEFQREHGWVLDNYHDGYIAILTETGIVGLALFAGATASIGAKLARAVGGKTLPKAYYVLLLSYFNLTYMIDFTETFFLRSTSIIPVLLNIFFFVACFAVRRAPVRPQRQAPAFAAAVAAR